MPFEAGAYSYRVILNWDKRAQYNKHKQNFGGHFGEIGFVTHYPSRKLANHGGPFGNSVR
jgi:hypothetical protein